MARLSLQREALQERPERQRPSGLFRLSRACHTEIRIRPQSAGAVPGSRTRARLNAGPEISKPHRTFGSRDTIPGNLTEFWTRVTTTPPEEGRPRNVREIQCKPGHSQQLHRPACKPACLQYPGSAAAA